MASKGYIFDWRNGHIIEEIDAEFECTWTMSAVNECRFTHPNNDKNIRKNFEFGNLLCVLNGEGLPSWVGKLDPTRGWNVNGAKHTAYSGEVIFNHRLGTYEKPYPLRGVTAGVIYSQLVTIANTEQDTLLRAGNIFAGGDNCGTTISPDVNLMANIEQIVRQSGHEWCVTPLITNNQLTMQANWYDGRGVFIDQGLNDDNCQMDKDPLEETGPIFNVILGRGPENDGSVRTHYLARDQASIDTFGLRAKSLICRSSDEAAIQAETEAELRRLAWPRRTYKASTTNRELFPYLRLMNILPFDSQKLGYTDSGRTGTSAYVKLVGMSHRDGSDGVVALTLKEYIL